MDFDDATQLYYSHQQLQLKPSDTGNDNHNEAANEAALRAAVSDGGDADEDAAVDLPSVRRHFREFLRKRYVAVTCVGNVNLESSFSLRHNPTPHLSFA